MMEKMTLENNNLNKPAYISKRGQKRKIANVNVMINTNNIKRTNIKMLEKRLENQRIWVRRVRKSRPFFLF